MSALFVLFGAVECDICKRRFWRLRSFRKHAHTTHRGCA